LNEVGSRLSPFRKAQTLMESVYILMRYGTDAISPAITKRRKS
jgi:hypothetical protein